MTNNPVPSSGHEKAKVRAYLFDFVANLNIPLLDGGLFGALAQIRQLDCNLGKVSAKHHLDSQKARPLPSKHTDKSNKDMIGGA